ncbi:site-2 protease family protein [Candidatus Woesearchaeota archaeon]|nr:site-2 protease family protein [Candidatus Woesearchaeota archaeon]
MNKKTKGAVSIGSIYGIKIELHYTWFFIFGLLAWALSTGFFPSYFDSMLINWSLGLIAAFFLFASVLAHELSHSIVAKLNDMPVKKITLFFFGGIAQIEGAELTPGKEFKMAIAGPLFSIALGVIFLVVYKITAGMTAPAALYITALSYYLCLMNFILAAFNLVPGFPLDGGRILRSILWKIYNNERKATRIAAAGGKIFAAVMVIGGFTGMFFGYGSLWFVILGIFLWMIADASYQQTALKSLLAGLVVSQIMNKKPATITETADVKELLRKFISTKKETIPVTKNKKITGMVMLSGIKGIPRKEWVKKKVRNLMRRGIKPAKLKEPLFHAFAKMIEQKLDVLPVIEKKKLVGTLHKGTVIHILRIRSHIS